MKLFAWWFNRGVGAAVDTMMSIFHRLGECVKLIILFFIGWVNAGCCLIWFFVFGMNLSDASYLQLKEVEMRCMSGSQCSFPWGEWRFCFASFYYSQLILLGIDSTRSRCFWWRDFMLIFDWMLVHSFRLLRLNDRFV